MIVRPAAVAFDVIETLMPLEPLRERFTTSGLPAHLLEWWFTRTLRDGIALAATGDYAPFGEVAAQALRIVSGYQLDEAGIAHVLAGPGELPAHPDAPPAARLLAGAGIRVALLTNGSAALTTAFAQRSGLDPARRAGHLGGRNQELETTCGGVPARRHGAECGTGPAGAGLRARLGLPRSQPGRADHRLGQPPRRRILPHLRPA
jgi:2-haloacid dehalogenase